MIEIMIPKDIREFEPTLLFIFTTRQTICGVAMIVLVYACYLLEKAVGIEDPMTNPIFIFAAIPPLLLGWFKPYGMHLEDFIVNAFTDNFLAPTKRPYKVENMWDKILEDESDEDIKQRRRSGEKVDVKKNQFKELPKNKLPKDLKPYR